MNTKNVIISLVFLAIGVYLIYFGFTRPCDLGPMTQTSEGQEIVIEQPEQLGRLICMSTDYFSLIAVLIGTAMIFPGVSGLYRSLTIESFDIKAKKNIRNKK